VAKIERVEVLMVDLVPKVKRVDAIQSFVSQETPFVRIFADDGAIGTGYTYTIGTGGPAIVELIARSLAPQLIGRDPDRIEEIWKALFFHTHATAVGAITSLSLAAIDTALWDMRCRRSGRPLHVEAGGAQTSVPLYTTEGGWLHLETAALVDDALRQKPPASAAQDQDGVIRRRMSPPEPCARQGGDGFEIAVDGNRAPRRRSHQARPALSLSDLACARAAPCRGLGGHIPPLASHLATDRGRQSRSTACRISANICSETHAASCRWTWRADRRHYALAEGQPTSPRSFNSPSAAFSDGTPRQPDGGRAEWALGRGSIQLDDLTRER
jgi:hypothetical protein